MPIIKSAKKRVRVTKRATIRNVHTKRSLRTALKAFAIKPTANSVNEANSALDIAVKKGVLHKNKAARQKQRISNQAKVAGVKPSKATKKSPAINSKKSKTVKKTPAKKPAVKKTTAKKK